VLGCSGWWGGSSSACWKIILFPLACLGLVARLKAPWQTLAQPGETEAKPPPDHPGDYGGGGGPQRARVAFSACRCFGKPEAGTAPAAVRLFQRQRPAHGRRCRRSSRGQRWHLQLVNTAAGISGFIVANPNCVVSGWHWR
jgi:hypothetical protein